MAKGYEAESTDVEAVRDTLVGERDIDDGMQWWTHLSSQQRVGLTRARAQQLVERGRR